VVHAAGLGQALGILQRQAMQGFKAGEGRAGLGLLGGRELHAQHGPAMALEGPGEELVVVGAIAGAGGEEEVVDDDLGAGLTQDIDGGGVDLAGPGELDAELLLGRAQADVVQIDQVDAGVQGLG
jgi:hypothetical protein